MTLSAYILTNEDRAEIAFWVDSNDRPDRAAIVYIDCEGDTLATKSAAAYLESIALHLEACGEYVNRGWTAGGCPLVAVAIRPACDAAQGGPHKCDKPGVWLVTQKQHGDATICDDCLTSHINDAVYSGGPVTVDRLPIVKP